MEMVPPLPRAIVSNRLWIPLQPGTHGPVAEIYRQATLDAIHNYAEQVSALSDAVRCLPDDDDAADELINRVLATQNTVGDFLRLFRQTREVRGQA